MIWAFFIYVFVLMLCPSGVHPVFQHWVPMLTVWVGGAVAVYLVARMVAAKASRELNHNHAKASQIRRRCMRHTLILQLLMFGGFYYFAHYLGFGHLLMNDLDLTSHLGWAAFIYAALIISLLFLIQLGGYGFATTWRHFRDTDRLAMGRRIYPWPTAVRYAIDNVRLTAGTVLVLLIYNAMIGYAGQQLLEWTHSPFLLRHAQSITEIVIVPLFWLVYPYLLVRLLNTQCLEDGELRTRLLAAAERHHIRITDVRVIQTHHRIANAAWIGTILPLRYIVLTDLVVDDFSPEEVEDIFAHELGHGRHRHATWYLLLLVTLVLWFSALAGEAATISGWAGSAAVLMMPALLILALFIAFGRFSQLSEYQADWFAVRHWASRSTGVDNSLGLAAPVPTEHHHLEREAMIRGAALGATTLRNLADENLLRTDRPFFTHPSIDDRITSLYTLSICPHIEQRLHRRAQWWRWAIALLLVGAMSCQIGLYFIR
jgi:Zn-dependent protease with chaperone function